MKNVSTFSGSKIWLLSKGQIDSIMVFGVFPYTMIFGATYICYIYLIYKALFVRYSYINIILLSIVSAFCGAYVYLGSSYLSSGVSALGAINVSFATGLLLVSFLLRLRVNLESSVVVDFLIILFFLICFINLIYPKVFGFESYALMQISSFNAALYLMIVKGWGRRFVLALEVVVGGGRSIIAGAIIGIILKRIPRLHTLLGWILLVAAVALLVSGVIAAIFQDYLQGLAGQGIFLKGRTGFWLALLGNDFTYFGNGAGASSYAVYGEIGILHQPHNELLRVYTDYGSLVLSALLFSLLMNSFKSPYALYCTSILAAFMATGNPLSFATVISCYVISISFRPTK